VPRAPDALQIDQAQRRFWLIVDAALAALVVMAGIGTWTYLEVRGSLRDVRAAGLATLAEAKSRSLQLWIEEKTRDAERWASTPALRREAGALAKLAAAGRVCDAAAQRGLQAEIAPFAQIEEVSLFNVIAKDGRIIASPRPEYCGLTVSAAFLRELAPVFEGRTVFVPPWREADRIAAAVPGEGPFAWIETPVHASDGTVVAALGFGRRAAERFAGLLVLTGRGTTRDAYVFDESARMVTAGRYAAQLAAAGAIDARQAEALGMQVRDPGGDLLAGFRPSEPAGSRPLTALAAAALARSDGPQGVLLDPYRNYRGARTIGAWRWLPEARLTLAVEIEAGEAYGPLEYVQIAFGVLLVLVLVSTFAAASTSLWAARMRMREARRVGPYRIEREIGEGGMSHVYLGSHEHLKRPAAVKVLKPHLATDEVVTRFRREAQLCSQLTHPNTIEIYDYGYARDGRWYYAMELLDGLPMEALVRRDGPMPVARVVHLLRQACGSLGEAHARGWVHRDVKPNNLMVCVRAGEHDVLKVVDFGLIKQVNNADTRNLTQYAKVLGTPLYMAPERLRNPADVDARADIYALGAVAYFALAGKAAFDAETDHDIVYKVMNSEPPPLARGDVPAELEALIRRCLEKERERRPSSIEEVRAVLDMLAQRLPWGEDDAGKIR
jgi:tRNA A-37 threonylcarbamoyl transferase component Bud32